MIKIIKNKQTNKTDKKLVRNAYPKLQKVSSINCTPGKNVCISTTKFCENQILRTVDFNLLDPKYVFPRTQLMKKLFIEWMENALIQCT